MSKKRLPVLLFFIALTGCAATQDARVSNFAEVNALPVPTEVKAFIDRRMGCAHWAGEGAEDRARAREIHRALADLRCSALERDERALRGRHRRSPAVIKALDETRDWI